MAQSQLDYESADDPLPYLKRIEDYMSSSSDDDMEEYNKTVTRIGRQFQAIPRQFGSISHARKDRYKIWDSNVLPPEEVENYLEQAREIWEISYLNKHKEFNEQDACLVLHIKKYNIQRALYAIRHERLPYIVCKIYTGLNFEKEYMANDFAQLEKGEILLLERSHISS